MGNYELYSFGNHGERTLFVLVGVQTRREQLRERRDIGSHGRAGRRRANVREEKSAGVQAESEARVFVYWLRRRCFALVFTLYASGACRDLGAARSKRPQSKSLTPSDLP
jgi:hypothetical protein